MPRLLSNGVTNWKCIPVLTSRFSFPADQPNVLKLARRCFNLGTRTLVNGLDLWKKSGWIQQFCYKKKKKNPNLTSRTVTSTSKYYKSLKQVHDLFVNYGICRQDTVIPKFKECTKSYTSAWTQEEKAATSRHKSKRQLPFGKGYCNPNTLETVSNCWFTASRWPTSLGFSTAYHTQQLRRWLHPAAAEI